MKIKQTYSILIIGLILLLSLNSNTLLSKANWEKGEIEDIEDWIAQAKELK